ncbi:MAG: EAL domain-containing protein [Nitrosomonas sp.]
MKPDLDHLLNQRSTDFEVRDKRFDDFIKSIPGVVFEFCVDEARHRSLSFISEGVADLIGYSAVECMANVEIIFDKISPEFIPALEASMRNSLEKLVPWIYEYPIETSSGEKWIWSYSIPQRNKNGTTCWRGVIVDITQQKNIEKALRDNEQLFRSVAEVAPIGIFRADATGEYVYVNERWCEIADMCDEMVLGSAWINCVHPDDRERVIYEWRNTVQQQRQFVSEYRFQTQKQKIKWIVGRAQIERDRRGNVLGYVGTIADITDRKMKEVALAESRNLLETIIDTAPVRIFWKDNELNYIGCNLVFAKDNGAESMQQIIGKNDYDLHCKKHADIYRNDDRQVIDTGLSKLAYEEPRNSPDGRILWQRTSKVPLRNHHNEIIGVLGTYQDITKEKHTYDSMRLAATIYQSSSEAIMVADENDLIIQINPAFTRMTGYTLTDVQGKSPEFLRSDCHDADFYQEIRRTLFNDDHWQGEIWDKHKDGALHAKWVSISVIRHKDNRIHYYVSQFTDITEKKKKDELLLFQANYDSLTGLPNRNLFKDRLEMKIQESRKNGSLLALLFLDLDHFKDINDTLGHDKGDELLKQVAIRIKSCITEQDTVARLGGDEFAVILSTIVDRTQIRLIAQNIIQNLNEPFNFDRSQTDYYISTSIGIVFYPDDGMQMKTLMKHADQAMYAAKHEGRNRFSCFTPSMQREAHEKMILIRDLRQAIERNELQVYYQPIIDLSSGRFVKGEALVRWDHRRRGLVSPTVFIPLAEESGLILEVGDAVFKHVIALIQQCSERWGYDVQISVNMSPLQFKFMNKFSWLKELERLGLPGNCINVEITESLLLKDSSVVQEHLLEFRNNGIEVSIDDFGTGFSSLSYLKKFDIDYLKIDRTFINQLMENETDRTLVEAIIVMAHKLNIKTVAEGVETKAQQELLMHLGCDYGQGFLYSQPIKAKAFEKLLMDNNNYIFLPKHFAH